MRRLLLPLPGVVLLVAGVVLIATGGLDSHSFGWFAYTPLDTDQPFDAQGVRLVTDSELLGSALAALGLAALTAYAGFLLGRRGRRA